MQPLPHQERSADHLIACLTKYGAALDASATGTGKTVTACRVAQKLGAKLAVVCPMSCTPSWKKTAEAMGVECVFVTHYEHCKTKKFPLGKLASGQRYVWNIPDKRVIFVFDEAHRCRTRGTINCNMLRAAVSRFKTLLLTATPFTDPLEAWGIVTALRVVSEEDYFSWTLHHGVRKQPWGGFKFVGKPEDIERIHHAVFPSRGVRVRHSDVPDFPETMITAEAVETGQADAIQAAYADMLRRQVETERAEHARWEMEVPGITRYLRERQEIELAKLGVVKEMAEESRDKGLQTAIFLNFRASVEALSVMLGCKHVIEGGQSGGMRVNAVNAFCENRIPFVIVNAASGGAGISLHDVTGAKRERTALIFPPISAVMFKQVLGRVHRTGGGFSRQRILFAAGTLEETRLLPRVQSKIRCLDTLIDGDLDILREV